MSAARLCTARLAPLFALAALSLIAGCTEPTPGYCIDDSDCGDAAAYVCNMTYHSCVAPDAGAAGAAGATGGAAGGDAGADKPTDAGAGEDHPVSTDGPGSDASDASADVFHPCANNLGCPDSTKSVCQTDGGVCVGCLQNSDCKAAGAHACDTAANKCVECVVNGDCTNPTKPVCENQACRSCKVDSDCAGVGPGVCMSHLDGRCATDSETVYVAPTGTYPCSDVDPTSGTSHKPFCTSQLAIDSTAPPRGGNADGGDAGAIDASATDGGDGGVPAPARTLVVMRGPAMLSQWSLNGESRTITVVGQLGATIAPGANIGIHVSGATAYIRSLRVSNSMSQNPAIVADSNSTLHLDRSIVSGNLSGGILINGAAYDITNTVIANNTHTQTPTCGFWAGICIVTEPQGASGEFLNNTVINPDSTNVACGGSYPMAGSIIAGSPGSADSFQCAVAPCCTSTTINVDPTTYHLTAGSSCIDKLGENMSTAYDFDGRPRPIGSASDCGAFEYVPPAGP